MKICMTGTDGANVVAHVNTNLKSYCIEDDRFKAGHIAIFGSFVFNFSKLSVAIYSSIIHVTIYSLYSRSVSEIISCWPCGLFQKMVEQVINNV